MLILSRFIGRNKVCGWHEIRVESYLFSMRRSLIRMKIEDFGSMRGEWQEVPEYWFLEVKWSDNEPRELILK